MPAFGIVRMLHGDTRRVMRAALIGLVATRPIYAGVHIAAFAALLIRPAYSLAGTFTHPIAWALVGSGCDLASLARQSPG